MKGATYKSGYYVLGAFALSMPSWAESEDFMEERLRLEDACRDALETAYIMMNRHGWSQFEAYDYAYDLLEGMSKCLFAMRLYDELALVRYYKTIANNKVNKAIHSM